MKDIDSLARSFLYASKGFVWMLSHERNFRIHITCLFYMVYFLTRYDFFVLSKIECAVLVLVSGLVLGGEMINTGIEKADDAVTREHIYSIKVSKDVAAGAVLVFAVSAVIIGIILLWQPEAFSALFEHYKANPYKIAILLVSFVFAFLFIFKCDAEKLKKTKLQSDIKKGKE